MAGGGGHDVPSLDPPATSAAPAAPVTLTDLAELGLEPLCVNSALDEQQDPFEICGPESNDPPELTGDIVASAFRRISLPESRLVIQPPNGRTLVNFATNFYTDNAPFDREVSLLGHRIELRITPATYAWHFGDGRSHTSSTPGAPYPEMGISHIYLERGRVGPSVDTTYTATWRADGRGPWLPVQGSVTVAGTASELEVLTATPTLVGHEK